MRAFKENPETPLKLFYLTYFGALGAVLPYLTLYFYTLGLSGAQIGLLSSLMMAANMAVAPVWTALADLLGKRKEIFIFNLLATTAVFALLLPVRSFAMVAVVVFSFSAFRSGLVPMANAMAFEQLGEQGEEYGRLRIWGSVGYIILALAVGRLIDKTSTHSLIYVGVLVYALCAVFSARGIQTRPKQMGAAVGRDLLRLFKNTRFMVFLACSFLVAMSGSPYILFFAISMRRAGVSQSIVGISWMVAVASEIVFMVNSPRIMRRFSVETLLIFSYLTWGLRWYLMSVTDSPAAIVFIHLLHGLNFGLYYPVAMNFLNREVPDSLRNTGQGLFSAMSYGTGGIVGNILSGVLYTSLGLDTLYRAGAFIAIATALLFTILIGTQRRPDLNENGST